MNPSDETAFRRVASFFGEGIGERTLAKLREFYRGNWIETLSFSERTRSLKVLLDRLRSCGDNYPRILEVALAESPYLKILERRFRKNFGKRQGASQNSKGKLRGGNRSRGFRERGAPQLTIHAAKGLEFSVVFLPRLEEDILPHRSALEEESELEEERRLFYVAVTRARDLLFLSYTREGGPSRFLSEIPKNLLNLEHFRRRKTTYGVDLKPNSRIREGVLVSHRIFGVGKVLCVMGEKAEVDFRGKIRRIHSAFLEVLD